MESASVVVNDPRLVTLWASPLFKLYYSNNINLGLGVILIAFIVPIAGMSPCLLIGQILVILNSLPWLAVMSKARMIRALKVPDLYVNCFNMVMPHIGFMITYNGVGLNAGYLVLASMFAVTATVSFIPFDIYQSRFVSSSIKGKISVVGPPLMLIAWVISRFAEYWYRADVLKVWDEDVNVGFFKTTPRTIACAGHLNNGVFFLKLIFSYLVLKRDFIFLNVGRKVARRGGISDATDASGTTIIGEKRHRRETTTSTATTTATVDTQPMSEQCSVEAGPTRTGEKRRSSVRAWEEPGPASSA
jgi:hypothetical protein